MDQLSLRGALRAEVSPSSSGWLVLGVLSLAAAMGLGRKLRCCSVLSPVTRPQWVCGTEGPCALGPGEHPGGLPVGKSHFGGKSTVTAGHAGWSLSPAKPNPCHRLKTQRDPGCLGVQSTWHLVPSFRDLPWRTGCLPARRPLRLDLLV